MCLPSGNRKPAIFVSYGNVEGARGIEQLRLVLVELRMAPLASAVHLRDVDRKLKRDNFEGDVDDERRLVRGLDDLHWWASALRSARSSQPTRHVKKGEHSSPLSIGRRVLVVGIAQEINPR